MTPAASARSCASIVRAPRRRSSTRSRSSSSAWRGRWSRIFSSRSIHKSTNSLLWLRSLPFASAIALRNPYVDPLSLLQIALLRKKRALPPGTGPRHFAFHPDGRHAYVIGELDEGVVALTKAREQAAAALNNSLVVGGLYDHESAPYQSVFGDFIPPERGLP
mgnify:CR=1 FL=1